MSRMATLALEQGVVNDLTVNPWIRDHADPGLMPQPAQAEGRGPLKTETLLGRVKGSTGEQPANALAALSKILNDPRRAPYGSSPTARS